MPNAKDAKGNEIEVVTQQDDGTLLQLDGSITGQDGRPVEETKHEDAEIKRPDPTIEQQAAQARAGAAVGAAVTDSKKGR